MINRGCYNIKNSKTAIKYNLLTQIPNLHVIYLWRITRKILVSIFYYILNPVKNKGGKLLIKVRFWVHIVSETQCDFFFLLVEKICNLTWKYNQTHMKQSQYLYSTDYHRNKSVPIVTLMLAASIWDFEIHFKLWIVSLRSQIFTNWNELAIVSYSFDAFWLFIGFFSS